MFPACCVTTACHGLSARPAYALGCLALGACAFLLAAPLTHAAVVWNESVNGDISGNRLAPTTVALSVGSNDVIGSVVGNPSDIDYPDRHGACRRQAVADYPRVVHIDRSEGIHRHPTRDHFYRAADRNERRESVGIHSFRSRHGNVGLDILPSMGTGPAPRALWHPWQRDPIHFGSSNWAALTNYDFNFAATQVPEPSSLLLAGAGWDFGRWSCRAVVAPGT